MDRFALVVMDTVKGFPRWNCEIADRQPDQYRPEKSAYMESSEPPMRHQYVNRVRPFLVTIAGSTFVSCCKDHSECNSADDTAATLKYSSMMALIPPIRACMYNSLMQHQGREILPSELLVAPPVASDPHLSSGLPGGAPGHPQQHWGFTNVTKRIQVYKKAQRPGVLNAKGRSGCEVLRSVSSGVRNSSEESEWRRWLMLVDASSQCWWLWLVDVGLILVEYFYDLPIIISHDSMSLAMNYWV